MAGSVDAVCRQSSHASEGIMAWLAIIAVLTLVILTSIVVGIASASKGNRTFMWVLMGALFVVLAIGGAVLMLKPGHVVLSVEGVAGMAFAGTVTVDGVE